MDWGDGVGLETQRNLFSCIPTSTAPTPIPQHLALSLSSCPKSNGSFLPCSFPRFSPEA